MFGPFASMEKKSRKAARHWLELAKKVYHYRRDCMSQEELDSLQGARMELSRCLKERVEVGKLKLAIENLESVLKEVGGKHYPRSGLVENVEFLLVAAIVILGIRAYFIQPFNIPTNSMWPSYHGMTAEIFETPEEEPGLPARFFRFLTLLTETHRVDAPTSGEVLIPLELTRSGAGERVNVLNERYTGRMLLLIPSRKAKYFLYVNDHWASVEVPADFDFEGLLVSTFFKGMRSIYEVLGRDGRNALLEKTVRDPEGRPTRMYFLKTGKRIQEGERLLAFDILAGDKLFVDRMSYHFVRPKAGDGFVFRTGGIKSPYLNVDQYYIKRLVGVPGDRLEIREPVLYRNEAPIEGAEAFDWNNRREGKYRGYFNGPHLLRRGQTVEVPEGKFMALGDNSGNSLDSRYWGYVPEEDVIGRPLFIYYPFTSRWGIAP